MAIRAATETVIRCRACNQRLGDVVKNTIERGDLDIEIKCPRCSEMNVITIGDRATEFAASRTRPIEAPTACEAREAHGT